MWFPGFAFLPRQGRAVLCGLLSVASGASCSSEVRLVSPDGPDDVASLASLEVVATVAEEDLEVASTLGWTDGVVPGATVHILRNGTATWESGIADNQGIVRFENLRPGLYRLFGERVLSQEEAEALGGEIRAWGDGTTLRVSETTTISLALGADQPGGLVISEIGIGAAPSWEVPPFTSRDGLFLEVYNNADGTLFLDGFLLSFVYFIPSLDVWWCPCECSRPFREDPEGLFAHYALQFPGEGTEYPIGPGETRVVAVLAQDLRQIHESMPDLSGADFEIVPPNKGDNPLVPNMIDVGFEPFEVGMLLGLHTVFFIATPLDFQALPILHRDNKNREFVRVPAEEIVESAAFVSLWPDEDVRSPPCIPMVHERFVRYEGGFFEIGFGVDPGQEAQRSLVRRVLRNGPFGPILMRTGASAVDFRVGSKSPGWIQ